MEGILRYIGGPSLPDKGFINMLSEEWPQAKGVLTAAAKLPKGERTRFIAASLPGKIDLWDKLLAVLDDFDQVTRTSPAWTGGTTFGAALSSLKNEVSPADTPLLAPGAVFGPYRVLKQLGAGGMGQVFLAKDQRLNRLVAIKSLAGRWLASPTARPRLLREARAAAALSHPNIATLYDVLEDSGLLIMEYVDGRPASVLLKDGPIAVGYAVRLAFQIAEAVSYAHDHGIIHCDIKPANVHVTVEGTAKVLDFGLARARFDRDEWEDLAPGQLLGTPGYMAPERLMRGTLNAAGDLYSTGVTIFEMVTGRRPFEEDDLSTLLLAVLAGGAPKASSIVADIPADLDRVIDRALVADPVQRYQSARELCRDMRAVLASVEAPSAIAGGVSSDHGGFRKQAGMPAWLRRSLLVTGYVAAMFLGLTLVGGITSRSYDSAVGDAAQQLRRVDLTADSHWLLRYRGRPAGAAAEGVAHPPSRPRCRRASRRQRRLRRRPRHRKRHRSQRMQVRAGSPPAPQSARRSGFDRLVGSGLASGARAAALGRGGGGGGGGATGLATNAIIVGTTGSASFAAISGMRIATDTISPCAVTDNSCGATVCPWNG